VVDFMTLRAKNAAYHFNRSQQTWHGIGISLQPTFLSFNKTNGLAPVFPVSLNQNFGSFRIIFTILDALLFHQ
jgi:hypothetical protein